MPLLSFERMPCFREEIRDKRNQAPLLGYTHCVTSSPMLDGVSYVLCPVKMMAPLPHPLL